jgi:hypothetical protein
MRLAGTTLASSILSSMMIECEWISCTSRLSQVQVPCKHLVVLLGFRFCKMMMIPTGLHMMMYCNAGAVVADTHDMTIQVARPVVWCSSTGA